MLAQTLHYYCSVVFALTLHYTTLLVIKCFFSTLDIIVVVSTIVSAAPIVGAAV